MWDVSRAVVWVVVWVVHLVATRDDSLIGRRKRRRRVSG